MSIAPLHHQLVTQMCKLLFHIGYSISVIKPTVFIIIMSTLIVTCMLLEEDQKVILFDLA